MIHRISDPSAQEGFDPFTWYEKHTVLDEWMVRNRPAPDGHAPTALRLRLLRGGYAPIPLYGKQPPIYGKNNKRKGLAGWQRLEVSSAQIKMWEKVWPDAVNTGALTWRTPAIDIDIRHPEAANALEELARGHFEERGRILVRIGLAPKRAILLRTNTPFEKMVRIFIAPDGSEQKIEILGDGQQLVFFGIHPDTQQPYRWHGGEPDTVARTELPDVCSDDVKKYLDEATTLLVEEFGFKSKDEPHSKKTDRVSPDKKDRVSPDKRAEVDPFTWAAGPSHRELAWAESALRSIGDELRGTKEGDRNNKLYRGAFRMGTMIARDWIARDSVESVLEEAAAAYTNDEGLKATRATIKSGIDGGLKCPHEDLTETLDDPAVGDTQQKPEDTESLSEPATQKPPSIESKVELFDPWAQFIVPEFPLDVLPPVVQEFVATQSEVIGVDQASMAMCVMSTFSGALSHLFSVKMMRHGNWYASPCLWVLLYGDPSTKKTPAIDTAAEPLEIYQKHLQHEYMEAMKAYEMALVMVEGTKNSDKPEPPNRFVVYDTTIEKLGEIIARNGGRGLLVKRDEFSGWIGSMEQYNSKGTAANRAFWLKAFDGGSYVVDRIGRGSIFIDHLSTSLIGGIQPERLAEMQGLTSDGLLQRFIPVVMGPSRFPQDRPTNDLAYAQLVNSLIIAKPNTLSLCNPALEVMREVQKHLHDVASHAGGLARGFQSFTVKLQGLAGNLALILHMAEDPKRGGDFPVSQKTVENVGRLITDFILPHAMEFYRGVESNTDGDRLKRLASWVLTSGKQRFVASDLTSNVAEFRGLPLFEVNKRVSPLVATGWLKEKDRGPENRAWDVNPTVFSQFAARGEEEEARKAKVAALMNSPRKKKEQ